MARNRVQFQKGYSLVQFMDDYGTEEKCTQALFRWRWPNGFVCPRCEHSGHWRHQSRALYQCRSCRHQVSLTAGTIPASTKLPLRIWFLAMYLMTQTKNGISALELSRQLAVSYNTAWKVKHKLMQVMKERDDTRPLGGWVQLDDVYWGGQRRGGKSVNFAGQRNIRLVFDYPKMYQNAPCAPSPTAHRARTNWPCLAGARLREPIYPRTGERSRATAAKAS